LISPEVDSVLFFPKDEMHALATTANAFIQFLSSPTSDILSVFPTQADDVRSQALWARLPFSTQAEESVFGGGSHSNLVRRWVELSQWYPSLTDSIGFTNNFAGTVGKVTNDDIQLDPYGGLRVSEKLNPITTHSFLYERVYSDVAPAFSIFKDRLK
jgi:hypothetical protein